MRLVTLNLNHRTRPRPLSPLLLDALGALAPDVLVCTEYVAGEGGDAASPALAARGLPHVLVSDAVRYAPGRWQNQVLVASRAPLVRRSRPAPAPERGGDTNLLEVESFGVSICGVRAPAYTRAAEWYAYWDWLGRAVQAGVVLGDLNVDPARGRRWDRVLDAFAAAGGWRRAEVEGAWSYAGPLGRRARLDHVLVRDGVQVQAARYVAEPFVPAWTDHAALVVDLDPGERGDGVVRRPACPGVREDRAAPAAPG